MSKFEVIEMHNERKNENDSLRLNIRLPTESQEKSCFKILSHIIKLLQKEEGLSKDFDDTSCFDMTTAEEFVMIYDNFAGKDIHCRIMPSIQMNKDTARELIRELEKVL